MNSVMTQNEGTHTPLEADIGLLTHTLDESARDST